MSSSLHFKGYPKSCKTLRMGNNSTRNQT